MNCTGKKMDLYLPCHSDGPHKQVTCGLPFFSRGNTYWVGLTVTELSVADMYKAFADIARAGGTAAWLWSKCVFVCQEKLQHRELVVPAGKHEVLIQWNGKGTSQRCRFFACRTDKFYDLQNSWMIPMSLILERIPPIGCFGSEWTVQAEHQYILHYKGSSHSSWILFEQALS